MLILQPNDIPSLYDYCHMYVLAQINWSLLLHLFSRDMADSRILQMAEMCLTFTELKIDVWMQHKASVAQNTPDLTLTTSPAK